MRKQVDPATARAAVLAVADWVRDPEGVDKPGRAARADAVRMTARLLEKDAPGHSVELRVPPFVAVHLIDGPAHTRGTPPNVVEMDPLTWLRLATGIDDFETATKDGRVDASGTRAALVAGLLPVIPLH
ncbi:hypothetical protein H0194_03795 [Corynebacterium incognita]|uniref:Bacterial SCP orthologue domain-containing protein n=1 Tax=Corynebacterium incognita TaxID=2754725 RepID=A0A7G7CRB1_9CORY|nr:sterol carrier family protein [Corynebacterium incognita]QNE90127.1 hypothetical protein H0194_03795 [Corynebacterium incognita]